MRDQIPPENLRPAPPPTAETPLAPTESLARQPVGRRLKIVSFTLPLDIYQRLLELGLTVGSECSVVRYAPLGDPMEVRVRGYGLSLRATEAEGVRVQALS